MIGYLRGRPLLINADDWVIDVGGVGYSVLCSRQSSQYLEGLDDAQLWIYTHVREDHIQLFGFAKIEEREVFLQLLKVNGIGPKMAIHILSATTLPELHRMIEAQDIKQLTSLPKVGKKTAEQIVLTLKDKIRPTDLAVAPAAKDRKDVVSALTNLGFKPSEAEKVVKGLPLEWSFEQAVRESLALLSQAERDVL